MCTLPTKSTLKAGKRHLEKLLEDAKGNAAFAADALAYEIALDCIDFSIEQIERAKERERIDREVDRVLARIFAQSWRG